MSVPYQNYKDRIPLFIDAVKRSNFSRFINHKCVNYNLDVKVMKNEYNWPVIVFQALKDIDIDEELTTNYAYDENEHIYTPCMCNEETCTKRVGYK